MRRSSSRQRTRPGDLAIQLTGLDEEAHLVGVGESHRELVTVGAREAQLLPERSGSPREQPRALDARLSRGIHRESREAGARPGRSLLGIHRNTPDKRVSAIRAELETRAADDPARSISLDPQAHPWRIESGQSQIGCPQKLSDRADIRRGHAFQLHPSIMPTLAAANRIAQSNPQPRRADYGMRRCSRRSPKMRKIMARVSTYS